LDLDPDVPGRRRLRAADALPPEHPGKRLDAEDALPAPVRSDEHRQTLARELVFVVGERREPRDPELEKPHHATFRHVSTMSARTSSRCSSGTVSAMFRSIASRGFIGSPWTRASASSEKSNFDRF